MKKFLLLAAACAVTAWQHSTAQTLIHYWNFNVVSSEAAQLAPTYTAGGGGIAHVQGGASAIDVAGGTGQNFNLLNLNARNGDVPGNHLRFNNPIGGTLIFSVPTTGFSDVVFTYATRRSGSGAGTQEIAYTTDGINFILFTSINPIDGDPSLQTLDFSAITAADNNPNFKIRVTFLQGPGGTVGNNRFDNATLDGTPAGADLVPPVVSFSPLPGATLLPVNTTATITFNEPVRNIDNSPINNTNAAALVELKLNNAAGANVVFTSSFAGNSITLTPLVPLANNQQYYVALKANTVEDLSNNAITTVQSAGFSTIAAQTIFNAGDLLLVAYQMNGVPNNDRIAFVSFVNILPGTLVNFTDAKYTSNIPAQCAGGLTWTAPAAGVVAGTVVTINNDAGTADLGTVSGSTFGLSANGDQVIVYTGTAANPNFITALSSNAWLATNSSCSGSFSMLPAALTDGLNSINLSTATGNTAGNTVNAYYAGSMNGSLAVLKASITNPANWVGAASATPAQQWPAWAFPGPPVVTSAAVINSTTLRIVFNRDLDNASATDINNFSGIAGLLSITRTNNGLLNDTLLLQYSNSFSNAATYSLTVASVKDAEQLAMATPFVFRFAYNTTVSFNAQVQSVAENAGQLSVQINLTNPSTSSVQLVVKTAPFSTAGAGDFILSTQTLNFTGSSSTTQMVTIPINDDGDSEQDEYIVLSLEDPSGLAITGTPFTTLYIRDNDRTAPVPTKQIELSYIGSYDPSGASNASSEIVVYDSATRRLFIISALQNRLDIADFSDPQAIKPITSVDMTPYGGITSVAVRNGIVAAAVPNANQQLNGSVVFLNTDGVFQNQVTVGALPDMITFTPDGTRVMTANEGQPNDSYTVDPEGSVSIIDVSGGISGVSQGSVTTLDFTSFNAQTAALLAAGVRKGFPGSTLSQDLEPEYITFSADGNTAWVILQEANAFAVIDITSKKITEIWPLGKKDHSLPGNGFDASDRGSNIHIANWPVKGLYMPDGIASYTLGGITYLVGANEGDDREYSAFNERVRVNDANYKLDPTVFPNATVLKNDNNLGRLRITKASGDTDGDGDFDEIHLIGGRSFSIWNSSTKALVYDSKDDFEQYLAKTPAFAPIFNADHESNALKGRSTSKGPEPEGLVLANIEGKQYAFIGLERQGGVMVYDITNPANPIFVDYKNPRNLGSYGGDNGPEGIFYISSNISPDGKNYIIVANEISGTLSVFRITNTAVCAPVGITAGPVDPLPVNNGFGKAVFSISASGGSPVTYQWQENGVNINDGGIYGGTNTPVLTITNAPASMNGKTYRAYVTNCLGNNSDTSHAATLTVGSAPALRISDVTVNEDDGHAAVRLCLSAVNNVPVKVKYQTFNGSAVSLLDYLTRTGTITIKAGDSCATIIVPIIDLPIPEATEQFLVRLSNPVNAVIGIGQATVTILDDDVIPTISIADITVPENAGNASLNICLSEPSRRPVSVFYSTANGTAYAGMDYSTRFGIKTIPAGHTCGSITVPIINNQYPEKTEYFYVNLGFSFNGSVKDSRAKVTITDNEGHNNRAVAVAANDDETTLRKTEQLVKARKILVSPNPFADQIRVSIQSPAEERATLSLLDISGRTLRTRSIQLVIGNNQLLFEGLDKLAAGTYIIQVISASGTEVHKVVKQYK